VVNSSDPALVPIAVVGVVIAVVAAVGTWAYFIVTYFLWLDARRLRSAAVVSVFPQPFDRTALYVSLIVENYGPAPATDFEFHFVIAASDGTTIDERRYREPVLGPGRQRRFLPRSPVSTTPTLTQLADQGATATIEWQWRDGRESPFQRFRRRLRHLGRYEPALEAQRATYSFSDYRDGLYGGGALAEAESLESIVAKMAESLDGLETSAEKLQQVWVERPRLLEALRAFRADEAAVKADKPPTPPKRRRRTSETPKVDS